jgi:hypothetical protein
MFDIIGKYIGEHYPALFVVGSIVIVVVFLCWKMFRLYGRLEKVEHHCTKIEEIPAEFKSVNSKLTNISTSIEKLFVFLNQQHTNFPTDLFVARSPIQLTDFGDQVLLAFGGKSYIDQNIDTLIKTMEGAEFKSALDVQNHAQSILFAQTQTDEFTHIKNFIFNNPKFSIGQSHVELTLPLVLNLMSIYLRNKYFEIYPALKDVEASQGTV